MRSSTATSLSRTMNTTLRTAVTRTACTSCSMISPAVRWPFSPMVPAAQAAAAAAAGADGRDDTTPSAAHGAGGRCWEAGLLSAHASPTRRAAHAVGVMLVGCRHTAPRSRREWCLDQCPLRHVLLALLRCSPTTASHVCCTTCPNTKTSRLLLWVRLLAVAAAASAAHLSHRRCSPSGSPLARTHTACRACCPSLLRPAASCTALQQ